MATQGIFGTDVDNFADVNSWSEVQPENFFGYFGMDNNYKIGFAKQFEKFYWGTYFSGDFGTYNEEVTKTDDDTVTITGQGVEVDPATGNLTQQDKTNVTLSNLFGFGNVGLRLDLFLNDAGSYSYKSDNYSKTVDMSNGGFLLTAGLKEYEFKKYKTAPRAYVLYYVDENDKGKIEETKKDTEDYRSTLFGLGAGADITLAKTEKSEQIATAELGFVSVNPKDTDYNSNKTVLFPISLGYKVTYNATDKLALGFKAGIDPTITSTKSKDAADKDVDTFGFSVDPEVAVALTYDTKKKVVLNAGVGFDIPSYDYSETKGDKVTETTHTWYGDDAELSFTSGFSVQPVNNISFDCSYEVLADLFGNNTSANFATGTETNFWNNVNKVLVHNIGFEVSVKF